MTAVEHNDRHYRIRISAGPDTQSLHPLTVNDDANPFLIDSDEFAGHLVFRIKGQDQIQGYEEGQQQDGLKIMPDSKWFEKAAAAGRGDSLMSMQVVGRFKREWTGDQVEFACVFDEPLKLPPLTSIAVKFFKAIDPGLQLDLQCAKPYFISPLLASMNTINVSSDPVSSNNTTLSASGVVAEDTKGQLVPTWPSYQGEHVFEDVTLIVLEEDEKKKSKITTNSGARRGHFAKTKNLSKHMYVKDHVYSLEMHNGFMDCSRFSIKLPGFSLDLYKYLNEQPITYTIRTQDGLVTFFSVRIELVPVEDLAQV